MVPQIVGYCNSTEGQAALLTTPCKMKKTPRFGVFNLFQGFFAIILQKAHEDVDTPSSLVDV